MGKKLLRDDSSKILGGVMAGFSNYFNHDVTIWRLGIVAIAIVTGIIPILVLYIVSWFVVPTEDDISYEEIE